MRKKHWFIGFITLSAMILTVFGLDQSPRSERCGKARESTL